VKKLVILATTLVLGIGAAVSAHALQGDDHAGVLISSLVDVPPTPLAPRENVEYVDGDNGFTGGHVAIEGNRLYLGSYGIGMRVYDISNPASPQLLGHYSPGLRADTPPDAAVFGGRHIAVLNGTRRTHTRSETTTGRTDMTEFIDFTDPKNPKLLWTFGPDQVDGESHNGDIVDARRLYLPSGGSGDQGLRIYNLDPLLRTTPAKPEIRFRGNPVTLWEASPYFNGKRGANFTHTHDIEVYVDYPVEGLGLRDIALLAEGGNYTSNAGNTGSMFVIDITTPRKPVVLYRWLHNTGADHHPIRYHHEVQLLDGSPRVALITDEDLHNGCGEAGGITAIRLARNLRSATELSEWFIPFGTPAPVCSVHVFTSEGPLVFLGSYNAGLQVVDYSDPADPRQVGHFIAEGATSWGAYHHQGYIYVGDMTRGLDVFRYTGPRPDLPDLTMARRDIRLSDREPNSGEVVTITATVRNHGASDAAPVVLRYTDNGNTIAERTIPSVPAGQSRTASVEWYTNGINGKRTIAVLADPDDRIDEQVEANNSASVTATVR
jgi:hypothetical protein